MNEEQKLDEQNPEAAEASGYSREHLRHLVAANAIPNRGRKGSPRIARKDLPRRAGKATQSGYDPAADAIALVSSRRPA